jgi:molybdopterin synthase sulfur carrier subunit
VRVGVKLFGSLRERSGHAELSLELAAGATPETAWRALVAASPELAPRRASLAVAVNRVYASFETELKPGDEVVFIPPVSGG